MMNPVQLATKHTLYILYLLATHLLRQTCGLTGLCQTPEGHETCLRCSNVPFPTLANIAPAPRDCCGDPYVFSLCEDCLRHPGQCFQPSPLAGTNEIAQKPPVRSKRHAVSYDDVGLARRAKYFLGKRSYSSPMMKSPYANDLGDNRDLEDAAILEEFFAAENKLPNPFWGKRSRPFLGKRVTYMLENSDEKLGQFDDEYSFLNEALLEKRQRPFLGKRFAGEDGGTSEDKRQRPFLGKREIADSDMYTFLESNANNYKRTRPFLGKRSNSNLDKIEQLQSFYVRPLTRRAKYFLGKRSEGSNSLENKRQKYFLGKRAGSVYGEHLLAPNDFVDALDGALRPETLADKRQKYFLGKRNFKDGVEPSRHIDNVATLEQRET